MLINDDMFLVSRYNVSLVPSHCRGRACDTYLKLSSGDLARTSEMIETQRSTFDGDDALCVQNLQSIADYIHSAGDLLTRVEEAVERFLYWDEEIMIYEAVTSSPSSHDVRVTG
uniref:Uncharacterized protein n=2 Tax=Amphimedon queenslandica TaxID=400682 RepID=A0A1X7T2X5_AMPQE